ncbi:helix-turn-helix domain-containing protein [Mesorhizobium xinjiangense]|uniref:hypothetical protein n=1 Tax=Mesorhizobium xinjiangense TaxID=2678685 RepID=UPI0012EE89F8|nr:hypothetical protein [Mesorhizobium xinjiangense]
MSALLLGTGFSADMGTCVRKLVLLKLIDACENDGTRIFPAVATVARVAQCSTRQVQRELKSFVEIGLLRLVREGGKGRRSTNEYAMDLGVLAEICREGWDAHVASKGDRESPLDAGAKGDVDGTDRVTQATLKGDIRSHPTPPDSSNEPSMARESTRERGDLNDEGNEEEGNGSVDDPAKFEKRVKKVAADTAWPGWAGSSTGWTVRQFAGLTDAERAEGEKSADRYLNHCRSKKISPVSLGVFFRDRKWTDLPDEVLNPMAGKPDDYAPPFGPVWGLWRMMHMLVTGSPDEDGRWKLVEHLNRKARIGQGHRFAERFHRKELLALMEAVPVGSEIYAAWEREHEKRGWPWVPDPGGQRVVYFPAGGPDGLSEFEAAMRGNSDDDGTRQAAE